MWYWVVNAFGLASHDAILFKGHCSLGVLFTFSLPLFRLYLFYLAVSLFYELTQSLTDNKRVNSAVELTVASGLEPVEE